MSRTTQTTCAILRLDLRTSLWRGSQRERVPFCFRDWKFSVDRSMHQAGLKSKGISIDKSKSCDGGGSCVSIQRQNSKRVRRSVGCTGRM